MFFDKLPFIKRVVFMAVPHRGSELATGFIGRLGASLIKLPAEVRGTASSLFTELKSSVGWDSDLANTPANQQFYLRFSSGGRSFPSRRWSISGRRSSRSS